MLAVLLNVADRLCVVVGGGGQAGAPRVRTLLQANARLRVVDPHTAAPPAWQGEWLAEPFQPSHLNQAHLVVACGPKAVNAAVVAAARAAGVWVADAADPPRGDFTFLATDSRGPLRLAVSTGGASPAVARLVLNHALGAIPDEMIHWVTILAELRPQVQAAPLPPVVRRRLLRELAHPNWLVRLATEGPAAVSAALHALLAAELEQLGFGARVPGPNPRPDREPDQHGDQHHPDAPQ